MYVYIHICIYIYVYIYIYIHALHEEPRIGGRMGFIQLAAIE